MAVKVVCDNCGKELKDKPSDVDDPTTFKPDRHCTLKLHIQGTNSYPVDLDLCIGCARKYVKILGEPI